MLVVYDCCRSVCFFMCVMFCCAFMMCMLFYVCVCVVHECLVFCMMSIFVFVVSLGVAFVYVRCTIMV